MPIDGNKLKKEVRHLLVYCCIGFCGAGVDFLFYCILLNCGVHYLVANAVSVLSGITLNFFLNAFLNFRITDHVWARFLSFSSIGLFGFLISSACLYTSVEIFSCDRVIAKIITIGIVVVIQFSLNRLITFKH